ncbi:MAG TPA: AAA family ATPase [Solirubrobacteraceae bacterium]|nr:AAA family ATPase [Solirubrobacteraceae bacterium]
MQLRFPSDAVVVVAGVPGAGKTTLIRRAVDRTTVRVVDTEDRRERGERATYIGHYARIVGAVAGRRPAVIHSRGTHAAARRAIALLARLRGRPAHLVMLDAPRAAAEAGQRRRGRTVPEPEMERHVARWRGLMRRVPAGEGWASVVVLDREQAAATREFAFVAPVTSTALAATI